MAIAKSYDVGDTVYVWYDGSTTDYFTPKSRTVTQVDIVSATDNKALVRFSDGNSVYDDDTNQRVFTTEAACATVIVNAVITNSAAAVALDTTTSLVSTAGNSSTTLGRIG